MTISLYTTVYHKGMANGTSGKPGNTVATTELMDSINRGIAEIADAQEAVNLFEGLGIPFSTGEELTGGIEFVTPDKLPAFFGQHMREAIMVISWEFIASDQKNGNYVNVIVASRYGKFRFNNGGSGICQQLKDITTARNNEPSALLPQAGLLVKNGLRVSEDYYFDDRTGNAISKVELPNVPEEHRKKGSPIYYFAL